MDDIVREFLRRAEAADYMSVSPATIDRWVREGRLTRYRMAGHEKVSRYRRSDLDALLVPENECAPRRPTRVY